MWRNSKAIVRAAKILVRFTRLTCCKCVKTNVTIAKKSSLSA
ncbi:hypothetical protein MNBD_ALPHA11-577 [hydrothermal vent metagenome]|uniref:Uncharacterized protein n=1 Tax=hydrothermal vent metagenome TaxID=652676 RepID=A0A3B0TVJ5_9ZZZZ